MRIRHTVDVHITADAGTTSNLFGPDAVYNKRVIDDMAQHFAGQQAIPGASTEVLSLGDLDDVRGLYLRASGDCLVTLNGGDPIALRRGSSEASATAKLFLEGEITSISVENEGTTALSCVYVIWGA